MNMLLQSPDEARELSRELREGDTPNLRRRRRATAFGLVAIGAMGVVALYQTGLLRHIPEPPLPGLDADKVDGSPEAYQTLGMPDGILGLGSYAATLALVTMGGADRARTHPWIPIAAAAKAAVDGVQAARLTVDQWTRHRAFCSWCLLAAGATWAVLPAVLPEAREAWRERDG